MSIMENEIRGWLLKSGAIQSEYYHSSTTGRVLDATPVENLIGDRQQSDLPDLPHSSGSRAQAAPRPSITELSRSPSSLVWLVPSPHGRYLLHVIARFYSLQSFSRPLSPLDPTVRVTHILRPQMVRPTAANQLGLDTPPGTDMSDIGGGITTGGESTASENETRGHGSNGVAVGEISSDFTSDDDDFDSASESSVGVSEAWEDVEGGRPARTLRIGEEIVLIEGGRTVPSDYSGDLEDIGGTDDEASTDGDGGVDSLASSFADLPAPSTDTSTAGPAQRALNGLPEHVVSSGTTTPRPLRARLPRSSFPPLARAPRAPSVDSSASEGPIHDSNDSFESDRSLRTLGSGSRWEMPERTLLEYIFD